MFKLKVAGALFVGFMALIGVLMIGSLLTAAGVNPIIAFVIPIIILGVLDDVRRRRKRMMRRD
jgi:hypothetical protein